MKHRISDNIKQVELSGIRRFTEYAKSVRPDCVFLTIGDPDFNTPERIKEAAISSIQKNNTHYPIGDGNLALRQKIALKENETYQSDYTAEEIFITNGCTGALAACFFTILNPGDEVIVPSPFYTLYRPIIEMAKGVVVTIDTTNSDFQLTTAQLDAAISDKTKAIILTSPNNPTGSIYSEASLEAVYQTTKEREVFVILDDVYNQIVYQDCPTFRVYKDMRAKTIILQSFSKPYAMTGWRIGYIMADHSIAHFFSMMNQFLTTGVVSFVQEASLTALDLEPTDMVETYRKRMEYGYKRLIEMGFDCVKPSGAFYFFPSIKKFGLTSEEFCERALLEYGVACVAGIYFESEGYIRLSYCTSDELLEEGLNRLESFVNSL